MGIHKERGEVVGLASFGGGGGGGGGGAGTNFDSLMGEVTDLVAAGGEVTDLVAAGGEVVEASLGDGGHCIKKGVSILPGDCMEGGRPELSVGLTAP